ncbi:DUF2515 domain-containing protein [Halobacillus fulvus]|nr:DUF2515 domain-containing protein [Halobacillus fulvus]
MWWKSKHQSLKKQLKKALKADSPPALSGKDKQIIRQIEIRTQEMNRNNVTRTKAYLDFYLRRPEIHWSLLAHLVSRNAGWNMTDLKGEHLPELLNEKEQVDFFRFIERGNWLIFQDAYPQLLLYEASQTLQRSLTHLLPHFGVSKFMVPCWDAFLKTNDSFFITKALIINEQNYIESRVIQQPLYKETVLDSILFSLQDLMNLNHILFPYLTSVQKQKRLIGHTVHHFSSLKERIQFGKEIYSLLYGIKTRHEQIVQWAKEVPHSGSRVDYWPDAFQTLKERPPGEDRHPRPNPCGISPNEPRIFSPKLEQCWGDQHHPSAEPGDWFQHMNDANELYTPFEDVEGDIVPSYCDTLEKLEFFTFSKKALIRKEENQNT